MTGSGTTPGAPEPGEGTAEDEVARLKAELARLQAPSAAAGAARQGWWRPVVAGLLVTVAALLAPLSVLATWASGQVGETDRYLETVAPLASDPAVQEAIAVRIETVVFGYLDPDAITDELVDALTARRLPATAEATLRAASGPLAAGIRNFVSEKIRALVQSDAFEQAWIEANRTAHEDLVSALTGDGNGTVAVDRGTVSINLAVLIGTLKGQLSDAGFGLAERIPEVPATFTILESADLAKVQTGLGILDDLALWLPFIGLGLVAVAVLIARDRRRMLMAAGLAVAASMLALGAALNIIRPFYLNALPASSSIAAAGAIYDQLVSFIRFALRGLLVMAVTVAVIAWLSAKSGAGAAARGGIVRGVDLLRGGTSRAGLRTGRFGIFLAEYARPIRFVVLGVAAVGYLAQAHPTGGTALTFVVVTAVALLLLELLAAKRPTDQTAASDGADPV